MTGVWLGIFVLVAMAIAAAYTMNLLADAEKVALQRRPQPLMNTTEDDLEKHEQPNTPVVRMTYPEVMRTLFPDFTFFGRNLLGDLVNFFIILTSVLVSCVYVLFIGTNMSGAPFNWKVDYIMLGLIVPVAGLAQLRSFKYLAFTSVLGDVAVTAGVVIARFHQLTSSRLVLSSLV